MRIVLSNASPSWGGVHDITEALQRGFQRRGHQVAVFGRPGSPLQARLGGVGPFEPILRGMDLHPGVIWRAARALRRHRADVVLTLTKKDVRLTGPAARALGIPVVVRHANDRPLGGNLTDRLLFGAFPAAHVANSAATRETLLRSARWLKPEAVSVIHNGVDPARFARAERAALGLPPHAVTLGFVGRFDERKGLLDLATAWPAVAASVPAAHLVIAGRGRTVAESGRTEERARELLAAAPRVHWLGYRTDVAGLMRALDVLAVPSHWEGFGLVAAEAMAAGVPVVATRASSLPEIVEDGVHGVLVPARDPGALADTLVRLAEDAPLRTRMGRAGQARVEAEFTVERMLDGYEALLSRVVRG